MSEKTQEQEMKLSYQQRRQPNCVYCKHPLDIIRQPDIGTIVWTWDGALNKYNKSEEGCAENPYHYCEECKDGCEASDWDYVDEAYVNY